MSMFKIIFAVLISIGFGVTEAKAIDQSICSSGKVVLHPNGSVKSCVPKDYFRAKKIVCESQSPISFYENGQIETCVLAQPVTIGGQLCQESGPINFYRNGKLKSCVTRN